MTTTNNNNNSNKEKSKHPMLDPTMCKELKERHDNCFNKWYTTSFLKGSLGVECQEEWEEYQDKLKAWNLEHLNEKQPPSQQQQQQNK
eukprot:gene2048-2523_t